MTARLSFRSTAYVRCSVCSDFCYREFRIKMAATPLYSSLLYQADGWTTSSEEALLLEEDTSEDGKGIWEFWKGCVDFSSNGMKTLKTFGREYLRRCAEEKKAIRIGGATLEKFVSENKDRPVYQRLRETREKELEATRKRLGGRIRRMRSLEELEECGCRRKDGQNE